MSTLQSRVVLFADMRGSTKLYEEIGNDAAHAAIGCSMAGSEALIHQAGGVVIKRLGDGFMAAFADASAALTAATEIQRINNAGRVRLGIGIQAGEVVERDTDLFGDAVNVAARLCALAIADEILVGRDAVDRLPPGRFALESIDKFQVKGKDRPIDVVRVNWDPFLERTTFVALGAPITPTPRLRLKALEAEFIVDPDRPLLTIGRQDCDLVIPDPSVSRRHAVIQWTAGRLILTDQSTNGTTIQYASGQESFIRRQDTDIVGVGIIALGPAPIAKVPCIRFECF
jgi:adenylate cyclase